MRKIILLISIVVTILILGSAAQISPASASSGKKPPDEKHGRTPVAPVVNKVLDLLDGEIFLDEETSRDVWRSRVFDTSRFTRIGLRAYGDAQGLIVCAVAWQFTDDDDFRPSIPWVWIGATWYQGPDPRVEFTEVRGLSARVICGLDSTTLGPGGGQPASGRLTDVKVMLRR